jgi:hypothetical protein
MESSGVPQTPPKDKIDKQVRFIATEAGITHFINGKGTKEDPYEPVPPTNIKDALIDAQSMAIHIQENVVFTFNGETISVDRYMNTSLINEKDKKHAGFESYLEKVSNDLREAGYRALTSELKNLLDSLPVLLKKSLINLAYKLTPQRI